MQPPSGKYSWDEETDISRLEKLKKKSVVLSSCADKLYEYLKTMRVHVDFEDITEEQLGSSSMFGFVQSLEDIALRFAYQSRALEERIKRLKDA